MRRFLRRLSTLPPLARIWDMVRWTRTTTDSRELEQFRLLLDGIADYAIFLLDTEGHIRRWSSAAEKMFGSPGALIQGRPFAAFYPEDDRQSGKPRRELQMAAAHGRYEDVGWRVRADGTRFWADTVLTPLREPDGVLRGFSQVIRDISERKAADEALRQKEEELVQARKMEAIGRLAGGVAHDFNNFITGIIGLSEDLRDSFPEGDPRREDAREIIRTADRASQLTRELLAFGRRQTTSPQVVNLNAAIEQKLKILPRLLGADIRVQTALDRGIGNVLIDPLQLDQLLVNLVMNARDAMPGGGTLRLETRRGLESDRRSRAAAGPHVALAISDTGTGMSPEVLSQVFEPFFTTKQLGKGTGLGLATVYGIVEQARGQISVRSQPGEGTTFTLLFPEIDAPVRDPSTPPAPPRTGRSETVLLAEDEDLVRRVAVRTLQQYGYRVLAAASGEEALKLARDPAGPIHVLLTDVIMPGMNGRELAARFHEMHPRAAIVYMSAYAADFIQPHGVRESPFSFIEKPFTGESLARQIQEALEHGGLKAANS